MGASSSSFLSPQDLENYQDCTFFTKKEILHIHKRFRNLKRDPRAEKLSIEEVKQLPELRVGISSPLNQQVNPFADRICKVFSEDRSGSMSFEDFLDCMSVFSEGATRDVKASYAFRLYGTRSAVHGDADAGGTFTWLPNCFVSWLFQQLQSVFAVHLHLRF